MSSVPVSATQAGDRLVWHFVADTANDFAWVASRSFIWEATRATIPTKGPIPVNIFYTPGRAAAFAGIGPSLRHALEFYSELYMPYPFPVHNAADGPDDGMEYPMIVMSSRGAADHETAHEWWPMSISNNETWYGWMDEGFNQYMNILSAADSRGTAPNLDGPGQGYGRSSGNESESSMMWDMNYGGPATSFVTYSKTPLMLSMLGGIVGDSAVWQAQSDWAQGVALQAPLAVGFHVLHEQRAAPGPRAGSGTPGSSPPRRSTVPSPASRPDRRKPTSPCIRPARCPHPSCSR